MSPLKSYQDGGSVTELYNAANYHLVNEAWDVFSEYIGENKLQTPLDLDEFEGIFSIVNINGKFDSVKVDILRSFRYDSYAWPMVKR